MKSNGHVSRLRRELKSNFRFQFNLLRFVKFGVEEDDIDVDHMNEMPMFTVIVECFCDEFREIKSILPNESEEDFGFLFSKKRQRK